MAVKGMDLPADEQAERIVCAALWDHLSFELAEQEAWRLDKPLPVTDAAHERVRARVQAAGLQPYHFWYPRARLAYAVITWLARTGAPITAEAVYNTLRRQPDPGKQIPWSWFEESSRALMTTYGIEWWAKRIIDLATARRVRAAGAAIASSSDGTAGKALTLLAAAVTEDRETLSVPYPPVGLQQDRGSESDDFRTGADP